MSPELFEYLSQLSRFFHVLFGILWIGLLYYFNFVGAGYLKEATPEGKKDVLQKLQPNALWYFRWAALFTFLTGVYLLYYVSLIPQAYNVGISLGATMATIMFLNVWLKSNYHVQIGQFLFHFGVGKVPQRRLCDL